MTINGQEMLAEVKAFSTGSFGWYLNGKTVVTIPSSGDLASVLDDVIPFALKSNDVVLAIIAADRTVASSTDRSAVLITLAERGAIRTPAARDAYLRAAQELPSSTDMRNALEALTRH